MEYFRSNPELEKSVGLEVVSIERGFPVFLSRAVASREMDNPQQETEFLLTIKKDISKITETLLPNRKIVLSGYQLLGEGQYMKDSSYEDEQISVQDVLDPMYTRDERAEYRAELAEIKRKLGAPDEVMYPLFFTHDAAEASEYALMDFHYIEDEIPTIGLYNVEAMEQIPGYDGLIVYNTVDAVEQTKMAELRISVL